MIKSTDPDPNPQPRSEIPFSLLQNVSYGNDPAQTMDIYLPPNRSTDSTKILALIHGGGFYTGNKTDLNRYMNIVQQFLPGYAIFNINYRMATTADTHFPAQENDINAAVQFIHSNTTSYSVSQKLILAGLSAGGTLALLQAYKYHFPMPAKAVISFFAPTDLREMYTSRANPMVSETLAQVIGKTPDEDSLIYASSSPVNFVTSASPPTLLFQGGLDPIVQPSQAVTLQNRLLNAGVLNQYVFYPTEGHGWFGTNLIDSFNKMSAFLSVNVS